jgi:NTE family protein
MGALIKHFRFEVVHCWVAGSSAGAVTAALIAGNRVGDRIDRLRAFWKCPAVVHHFYPTPWRHLYGWMGAFRTRILGSAGHFHPRMPSMTPVGFRSLYDLTPMRERLTKLIDFGQLNSGEVRVSVVATEIDTGEPVLFDSRKDRIEMHHLLASCGFIPEFALVDVGARLLGDGGLSLNAPFDPIMESEFGGDLLVYVIDLYARDGDRPVSLIAAAERKNDLLFGNQTFLRLKYGAELRRLRKQLAGTPSTGSGDKVVLLSYRPGLEEPGPEKSFELSAAAFAQRWNAGLLDMEHSQHAHQNGDISVVRRPRDQAGTRDQ